MQFRIVTGDISIKMRDCVRQRHGYRNAHSAVEPDAPATREPERVKRFESIGNDLRIDGGLAKTDFHGHDTLRLRDDGRCKG